MQGEQSDRRSLVRWSQEDVENRWASGDERRVIPRVHGLVVSFPKLVASLRCPHFHSLVPAPLCPMAGKLR